VANYPFEPSRGRIGTPGDSEHDLKFSESSFGVVFEPLASLTNRSVESEWLPVEQIDEVN
jgi:hypothetical protein